MAATTEQLKSAVESANTKSGNTDSFVFTNDDLQKRAERHAGGNSNQALRAGDQVTIPAINIVKPIKNTRATATQNPNYPGVFVDVLRAGGHIDQALSVNTFDATVYPVSSTTLHKVPVMEEVDGVKKQATWTTSEGKTELEWDYYVALADQKPRFAKAHNIGATRNEEIDGKQCGVLEFPTEITMSLKNEQCYSTEFNSYNSEYKGVKVRKDPFTHEPIKSDVACAL